MCRSHLQKVSDGAAVTVHDGTFQMHATPTGNTARSHRVLSTRW